MQICKTSVDTEIVKVQSVDVSLSSETCNLQNQSIETTKAEPPETLLITTKGYTVKPIEIVKHMNRSIVN